MTEASDEADFLLTLGRVVARRLAAAGQVGPDDDLILVGVPEGFAIPGNAREATDAFVLDRAWSARIISGDFGLRWVLARTDDPLVAIVTCPSTALQVDLRERAVLRKVVTPLARDLIATLAGREAAAIDEGRIRPLLVEQLASSFGRLRRSAAGYTWGSIAQESDALTLVGSIALDLDRAPLAANATDVLTSWLRSPPPYDGSASGIVPDELIRRFPHQGSILKYALSVGVRRFVTQTAATDRIANIAVPADRAQLVEGALAAFKDDDLAVRRVILSDAEAAWVAARKPPSDFRLLETAYAARVRELLRACRTAAAPTSAEINDLRSFLFARDLEIQTIGAIARLARGVAAAELPRAAATVEEFGAVFGEVLAWGDLAARRARDAAAFDDSVRELQQTLVERWFGLRDDWNARFAAVAARDWSHAMNGRRKDGPLALHRILGEVVRPIVLPPAGKMARHVFLVVLDGCDLPSFYEIVRALEHAGISTVLPPQSAELTLLTAAASDGPIPRVALGIAPMPTVTSHARRSIFAGQIPDAAVIDEREAVAAASSADAKAFDLAVPLKGVTRRLFLKGDLASDGADLKALLDAPDLAPLVVAAVFNDVDDALSGKQRGVLPEWRLNNLGALVQALAVAARRDWVTILTADHGHTPYRHEGDMRLGGFAGSRYIELPHGPAPVPHSVIFEKGLDVPRRMAALYRVGEHGYSEHLGYHGGASLEEVFVPIACLGAGALDSRSISEPDWWTGEPRVDRPRAEPAASARAVADSSAPVQGNGRGAKPSTSSHADTDALQRIYPVLSEQNYAIVASLAQHRVLDAAQIAQAHRLKTGMVTGRLEEIVALLAEAGLPDCIEIDDEHRRYAWRPR